MTATGFVMWNPISTVKFLPGEIIPAAEAAHGAEAIFAVHAIIWHEYGIHIKHFNKSMWTSEISEEDMLYEHPLELAERVYFPVAALLALVMLGGVYRFLNAETTALVTTERRAPTIEVYVLQTPTQPITDCIPSTPSSALIWDNTIGALFQSTYTTCHGLAATAGLNFTTYSNDMKGSASEPVILSGDSVNSLLVKKQEAGEHPGQFTPEEIAKIIAWIDAGAPEK